MTDKYEEIIEKLKTAELSISDAKKLLGITKDTKIIKTQIEFNSTIEDIAKFLAKSDAYSTINGVKQRLLKLKKFPNVKEAYEIQEKFGVPVYAWKDITFYKKSLPPKNKLQGN